MTRLKRGVHLCGITPQMAAALVVIQSAFDYHQAGEVVITSVSDGRHSRGSLHYQGNAFDIRTFTMDGIKQSEVVNTMSDWLGSEFDVVLESDHIHVEWQPKG